MKTDILLFLCQIDWLSGFFIDPFDPLKFRGHRYHMLLFQLVGTCLIDIHVDTCKYRNTQQHSVESEDTTTYDNRGQNPETGKSRYITKDLWS